MKESIVLQRFGSCDFWHIANSVLNRGKSAIHPLCNSPEVLTSTSDITLNNMVITPKMVKRAISNLDSYKVLGPDGVPVVVLTNCQPELSY